jgi:hypothetical protein
MSLYDVPAFEENDRIVSASDRAMALCVLLSRLVYQ